MFCSFCGSQVNDSAYFCQACGNNLKASDQVVNKSAVQQQSTQNYVQYQHVEFVVQRKLLALRPVFTIKDAAGREFMEAKRSFINFLFPHIYVNSPDGKRIGDIKGNIFRSEWKITDAQGNLQATIHMPFLMFFNKHFTLDTSTGQYRSGDTFFAYNWICYNPQGQPSFEIDKKVLAIRDSFKIRSYGTLSPFITTMAAICIDMRFFPKETFV